MNIHAEKWHAYGNDFILVSDDLSDQSRLSRLAQSICKRHEGVGADGLVGFDRLATDARCRIFNMDGSEAEISGNGVRCLAGFLKRELPQENVFLIHSGAGVRMLTFLREELGGFWFRADMGDPRFDPAALPAAVQGETALRHPIRVDEVTVEVNLVSLGNPHCVVFVPEFRQEEWAQLGSQLESHPIFPRRTNVEFVRVVDRHNIELRIWERGVGKTFSSGTCSCASAAVSIRAKLADSPVHVHNEKGTLTVEWRHGEHIFIEGPAMPVWKGEFLWNSEG
ncbi:MAG TPA: diaminopimelate epimerase [Acidobacteriota bacterium]|nr:diaminopimelate epimerase [Acidobacteriota bacterium]